MRFLEDFKEVYNTATEATLLAVQNAVFEYFNGQQKSARTVSTELSAEKDDTQHKGNVCSCHLIPHEGITFDELALYRRLLTTAASGSTKCAEKGKKRKKADKMDELKTLHARIIRAQMGIQQQLLNCKPCSHGILPAQCESALFECASKQVNHPLPNAYERFESISHLKSGNVPINFRSVQTLAMQKLVIPVAGKSRLVYSDQLRTFMNSSATENSRVSSSVPDSSITGRNPIFHIPESVLISLFTQLPLIGIYIPFTISEVFEHGHKCKRVRFDQPLWFSPPDPRTRARLFYQYATLFYLCDKPIITTTDAAAKPHVDHVETKAPASDNQARKSEPIPSPSIDPGSMKPGTCRKSARIRKNSTGAKSVDVPPVDSVDKKPERFSASVTPKSVVEGAKLRTRSRNSTAPIPKSPVRRSQRRLSSTPSKSPKAKHMSSCSVSAESDEGDNTGAGNLSIDMAVDSTSKDDNTPDFTTLREQILTTCVVVNRIKDATQSVGFPSNEPLDPASPGGDAPASPESNAEDEWNAAQLGQLKSPGTRVIPLEPVHSTPRSSSKASSTRSVSPQRNTADSKPDHDNAAASPVCIAKLEVDGKTVLVPYTNTVWSPGESCLACCATSEAGQCPLWPSCSSLKPRWEENASKWGDLQPVFLQVKPEYLGDWGCEVLHPSESVGAWLGSVIRNKADIVRVRVRVDTGEIVWVEYQSLDNLLSSNPSMRPGCNAAFLSALFDKLVSFAPGSYLLSQNEVSSYVCYRSVCNQHQSVDDSSLSIAQRPGVFQLSDMFQRMDSTSSALVNLAGLCGLTEGTDKESCLSGIITSSWLTVTRAMLDLDIPAGLEPGALLSSERVLRLPAFPTSRLSRSSQTHQESSPRPDQDTRESPSVPVKRLKSEKPNRSAGQSKTPSKPGNTKSAQKRSRQRRSTNVSK